MRFSLERDVWVCFEEGLCTFLTRRYIASWGGTKESITNTIIIYSVTKRLQQELMQLMMNSEEGTTAFPDGDNLFEWVATITGTEGTPYADQTYKLSITFPADYPYTAPTFKFTTPLFHPNIDVHGNICLDILKEKWR